MNYLIIAMVLFNIATIAMLKSSKWVSRPTSKEPYKQVIVVTYLTKEAVIGLCLEWGTFFIILAVFSAMAS